MSVSTKELFTAFFKGLAFAKGLNFGEKNRGMAEDRWITIHPWGMSQGEADTGEGKGYYRRIFIDDETGEIEKGLGAGTNIKDLSKTLKAKKNGEEAETTSKKDDTNLSDLARKIKALTDGKEYTEEVANQVGDVMRQELEKNQKFADLVRRLDLSKKYSEIDKQSNNINENKKYRDARNALEDYRFELIDKLNKGEITSITKDPKYMQLRADVDKAREEAFEENKNIILKKLNVSEKDRDFVSKPHYPGDRDISQQMADIIKEQFKDIIDFNNGNNIKSSKPQKANVANGLALYSKEFVAALENKGIEVKTIRKGSRAFYSVGYGEVNVTLQDSYGTIAHEFAHALENAVPKIRELEREFYDRRTEGEEAVSLRQLTGKPYGYREYAKPDKFLSPYIGKDYSARGRDHDYEVLSMGMTYLYDKPDELVKDRDYMNFVLGCLAYKG
jgi:hypothetical protein